MSVATPPLPHKHLWRVQTEHYLNFMRPYITQTDLHYHHHHISSMELGHLLTPSGLTYSELSSKVYHESFCQLRSSGHSGITVSPGMEEMSSLNMPVQRLKVAILPLDLPCSGPVTNSGEILITGKSRLHYIILHYTQPRYVCHSHTNPANSICFSNNLKALI